MPTDKDRLFPEFGEMLFELARRKVARANRKMNRSFLKAAAAYVCDALIYSRESDKLPYRFFRGDLRNLSAEHLRNLLRDLAASPAALTSVRELRRLLRVGPREFHELEYDPILLERLSYDPVRYERATQEWRDSRRYRLLITEPFALLKSLLKAHRSTFRAYLADRWLVAMVALRRNRAYDSDQVEFDREKPFMSPEIRLEGTRLVEKGRRVMERFIFRFSVAFIIQAGLIVYLPYWAIFFLTWIPAISALREFYQLEPLWTTFWPEVYAGAS